MRIVSLLIPFLLLATRLFAQNEVVVYDDPVRPAYIPLSCQTRPLLKMTKEAMLKLTLDKPGPDPEISKADQLLVTGALISLISERYLHQDSLGSKWNERASALRSKVNNGLSTTEFYETLRKFVTDLNDRHSYFQSPASIELERAQLAGQRGFVGIGALVQPILKKNYVTLLSVSPNSPAERHGLKPHDIILNVDGLSLVKDENVFPLTRGPECTVATLLVQSPGKPSRIVRMVREPVSGAREIDARLVPDPSGRKIGYLFIPTFLDTTIKYKIRAALKDFGPLDGLVIDNRMNRGGSSIVLNAFLSHFISGQIGQFTGSTKTRPLELVADPIHNSMAVPLVVLVSQNTVSYGEVFSGILQERGRAKLVGDTTAGKVETLNAFVFKDGSRLWLATEKFELMSKTVSWQGQGVRPDIIVEAEWDEFTFENDPALAAALKLFPQK